MDHTQKQHQLYCWDNIKTLCTLLFEEYKQWVTGSGGAFITTSQVKKNQTKI